VRATEKARGLAAQSFAVIPPDIEKSEQRETMLLDIIKQSEIPIHTVTKYEPRKDKPTRAEAWEAEQSKKETNK